MISTLNFGIPIVFAFQLEVYYKADRILTGLNAQQKGTTARWYSNKTSLIKFSNKFLVSNSPRRSFLTNLILLEESDGSRASGKDSLPNGHFRERLLWASVYRPQSCQSLARPYKTSQKTNKK